MKWLTDLPQTFSLWMAGSVIGFWIVAGFFGLILYHQGWFR